MLPSKFGKIKKNYYKSVLYENDRRIKTFREDGEFV